MCACRARVGETGTREGDAEVPSLSAAGEQQGHQGLTTQHEDGVRTRVCVCVCVISGCNLYHNDACSVMFTLIYLPILILNLSA